MLCNKSSMAQQPEPHIKTAGAETVLSLLLLSYNKHNTKRSTTSRIPGLLHAWFGIISTQSQQVAILSKDRGSPIF